MQKVIIREDQIKEILLPPEKVYIVSSEKETKVVGIFSSLPQIVTNVGKIALMEFGKKRRFIKLTTLKGKVFIIKEAKLNQRLS
jgi:hypothetical protein